MHFYHETTSIFWDSFILYREFKCSALELLCNSPCDPRNKMWQCRTLNNVTMSYVEESAERIHVATNVTCTYSECMWIASTLITCFRNRISPSIDRRGRPPVLVFHEQGEVFENLKTRNTQVRWVQRRSTFGIDQFWSRDENFRECRDGKMTREQVNPPPYY